MARTGDHLSRYTMYKTIARQAQGLDLGRRVLSVSNSMDLCRRLGVADQDIQEANYPDIRINATGLPPESVTAVISDQVFEHLRVSAQRGRCRGAPHPRTRWYCHSHDLLPDAVPRESDV